MSAHDGLWLFPPSHISLSVQDVHVWRASLKMEASRLQRLRRTLSEDELTRAERFHFDEDRGYFIAARGLLRAILARYLGVEAGRLQFSYSSHGKPSLMHTLSEETLSFNLSHSHGLALFAVARGRPIGIDLERFIPDFDYRRIAQQFFPARENALLDTLPQPLGRHHFFSYWTRLEAYLKAGGEGLSSPKDRIDVSDTPDQPAIRPRAGAEAAWEWSIQTLFADGNYAAALAVKGHDYRLAYWQWQDCDLDHGDARSLQNEMM
jgi:4'-phosphopantetheinyl transferase